MSGPPRVVITGFMGAGKTTVARSLARRLGCEAIDLDDLVAAREGRTPQQLIEEDGEEAFREKESAALRAALEDGCARVVATGGGAWAVARNRALAAAHGCATVWLDAPFELCWLRIERDGAARPLARERGRARELYAARRAAYALAGLRVAVTHLRDADDIAREIAAALARREV